MSTKLELKPATAFAQFAEKCRAPKAEHTQSKRHCGASRTQEDRTTAVAADALRLSPEQRGKAARLRPSSSTIDDSPKNGAAENREVSTPVDLLTPLPVDLGSMREEDVQGLFGLELVPQDDSLDSLGSLGPQDSQDSLSSLPVMNLDSIPSAAGGAGEAVAAEDDIAENLVGLPVAAENAVLAPRLELDESAGEEAVAAEDAIAENLVGLPVVTEAEANLLPV